MATLIILLGTSGISLRKPKLADLHPVNVYRNADRRLHLAYASSVKYVSDLRVVYEIQSRLRQDENDLQIRRKRVRRNPRRRSSLARVMTTPMRNRSSRIAQMKLAGRWNCWQRSVPQYSRGAFDEMCGASRCGGIGFLPELRETDVSGMRAAGARCAVLRGLPGQGCRISARARGDHA